MTLRHTGEERCYVTGMQPTPVRDFSGRTKSIQFTADGDTFYGVPRVATFLLTDIVAQVNAATTLDEKVAYVTTFFKTCLTDESAELITTRMRDKHNPIDLPQAMDIVSYLVEVYGDRPTQPSESSSAGSTTETGTTSTDGAPSEVSIPVTSPSLDS